MKNPWLGAGAKIQTFAEYWQDTGPDGLLLGDEGYEEADPGEKMEDGTPVNNLLTQIMASGMISENQKSFLPTYKMLLRCLGW